MTNNVLVEASMADVRVLTGAGATYGDNKHVVEVVPWEFRSLIPYYPIFLSKDSAVGRYTFVAVCGFEADENLFLDGDDWSVPYVPINIRRQPFNVIATEGTNEQGESVQLPALSIDLDSPRISSEGGERLFDENQQPTEFLNNMNQMIRALVESTPLGRHLAQRLDNEGLIEPMTMGFELANGQKHSVGGLFTLNEDKFRALPEATVMDMHRMGQLGSLYCMMASWGQIGGLLERKNARLGTGTGNATP